MEKQVKFYESIPGVALGTAVLLSIPLVAMQFTDEVNWGPVDFLIAGLLIFGAGFAYVMFIRYQSTLVYKAAIASSIGSTFLMVWANLGVGLIGSGPHTGNLMYIGVVLLLFIGVYLSRFKPAGLERTMFSAALLLLLFAVIQIFAGMHEYPGSSMAEIIGVNAFFAGLFGFSGLLFRYVVLQQSEDR